MSEPVLFFAFECDGFQSKTVIVGTHMFTDQGTPLLCSLSRVPSGRSVSPMYVGWQSAQLTWYTRPNCSHFRTLSFGRTIWLDQMVLYGRIWVVTPALRNSLAMLSVTLPTYGMLTLPLVPLETSGEGCSDRALGVVATFQAFLEYPDTLSTFLTWLIS